MIIFLMLSEVNNLYVWCFCERDRIYNDRYIGMVYKLCRPSVMGIGTEHRRLVRARSAPLNRNTPSCVCNGCSILVFIRERIHRHRGYASISFYTYSSEFRISHNPQLV